jgi:hypothetical protein
MTTVSYRHSNFCTVEQRNRTRRVQQGIGDRLDVLTTELASPVLVPSGPWAVETSLDPDGLPPTIEMTLGEDEMTADYIGPRQLWWQYVAVV